MLLTTTKSQQLTEEQLRQLEDFLREFLPRVKQLPGVVEILLYVFPGQGEATTVFIWGSAGAIQRYREGGLFQEALAFEQSLGISPTREGPFLLAQRLI